MSRAIRCDLSSRGLRACAALGLLALLGSCGDARAVAPRTVILISIDTLRPERLGVYGGGSDVSPGIDALAAEACVFDRALAVAPWTLPSHMSMLTGLDPVAHGVQRTSDVLPAEVDTLAELLAAHGFRTAAFTDGGFVSGAFGFDQGFEVYSDQASEGRGGFTRLIPDALRWLDERAGEDCFLFLHTFDVHAPYDAGDREIRDRFRKRPAVESEADCALFRASFLLSQSVARVSSYARISELLNDYDAGIQEADRGVRRLLESLRSSGRYDGALIVVTSDHGESFFDHDLYAGHGLFLTDDELAVPLIVKFPRAEAAGRRFDALVDHLDLVPTVLDVCGIETAHTWSGESLRSLPRGVPRARTTVFGACANTSTFFLVEGRYKYITASEQWPMSIALQHLGPITPPLVTEALRGTAYTLGVAPAAVELVYDKGGDPLGLRQRIPVGARLFDRASDPREERNLATSEPAIVARMEAHLKSLWESSRQTASVLDRFRRRQLPDADRMREITKLGYVLSEPDEDPQAAVWNDRPKGALFVAGPDEGRELAPIDARVHHIRSASGQVPTDEIARTVRDYVTWGVAHPDRRAAIDWRLRAALDVARTKGVDVGPLEELLRPWLDVLRAQATSTK